MLPLLPGQARPDQLAVRHLLRKSQTDRGTAFRALRGHAWAPRQNMKKAAARVLLAERTVDSLDPEPEERGGRDHCHRG